VQDNTAQELVKCPAQLCTTVQLVAGVLVTRAGILNIMHRWRIQSCATLKAACVAAQRLTYPFLPLATFVSSASVCAVLRYCPNSMLCRNSNVRQKSSHPSSSSMVASSACTSAWCMSCLLARLQGHERTDASNVHNTG
jgi:hypothetical protein